MYAGCVIVRTLTISTSYVKVVCDVQTPFLRYDPKRTKTPATKNVTNAALRLSEDVIFL